MRETKKKKRKMTTNKNTFAKTAAIRAGREKRASVANYDPPRCPASNRLKRQRGGKERKYHLSSALHYDSWIQRATTSQTVIPVGIRVCVCVPPAGPAGLPTANFLVMFLLATTAY